MKVIQIADKNKLSVSQSVEDMLLSAMEEKHKAKKAILIYLDDEEGKYIISTRSAGFDKTSELVALLEIKKLQLIADEMECI